MPKVSVIIPVYNVEQYLRECLDSVVNQTLKDIEIICVNDGSTDNSLVILEEYAAKDERIKILSQENQGVSVARNVGIEKSSADYIMFVDPDDSIAPEACELSLKKIFESDTDICCFGANEKRGKKIKPRSWEEELFEIYKNKELDLRGKKNFSVNVWGKLFKKSFLKEKRIFFPIGIKTGEDAIFNLSCLFNGAKYALLNKFLYNYLINRENSAINNLKDALKNDIKGYKYFINTELFKTADDSLKVIALEKFIGQISYYYKNSSKYKLKYFIQIMLFRKYLIQNISREIFRKIPNIKFISPCIFSNIIFSLRNQYIQSHKYKIITILGIDFKLRKSTL